MHTGGVFKRVEYFLVGHCLAQALRALRLATTSQSIIVSYEMCQLVKEFYRCEPAANALNNEAKLKYLYGHGIRSKANTLLLRTKIE